MLSSPAGLSLPAGSSSAREIVGVKAAANMMTKQRTALPRVRGRIGFRVDLIKASVDSNIAQIAAQTLQDLCELQPTAHAAI